jgi:hypothetical protein
MSSSEPDQGSDDDLLRNSSVRVDRVELPHDLNTRYERVQREFKNIRKGQTLQEVIECTSEALQNLEDLGVFREVNAELLPGVSVCNQRVSICFLSPARVEFCRPLCLSITL